MTLSPGEARAYLSIESDRLTNEGRPWSLDPRPGEPTPSTGTMTPLRYLAALEAKVQRLELGNLAGGVREQLLELVRESADKLHRELCKRSDRSYSPLVRPGEVRVKLFDQYGRFVRVDRRREEDVLSFITYVEPAPVRSSSFFEMPVSQPIRSFQRIGIEHDEDGEFVRYEERG